MTNNTNTPEQSPEGKDVFIEKHLANIKKLQAKYAKEMARRRKSEPVMYINIPDQQQWQEMDKDEKYAYLNPDWKKWNKEQEDKRLDADPQTLKAAFEYGTGFGAADLYSHIRQESFIVGVKWDRHLQSQPIPPLGWVKASKQLPEVGKTHAARGIERKKNERPFTWMIVKNGSVSIDVDSCYLDSPNLALFIEGWEWLEESLLPVQPIQKVELRTLFLQWLDLCSIDESSIVGNHVRDFVRFALKESPYESSGQPSIEPHAPTNPVKYFFDQDDDSHWYMIPIERREEWQNAGHLNLDTDKGYKEWQKGHWEDYRTGGGISDIEFSVM